MDDILGIHTIDPGLESGGIGWVVIPDGVNRDDYIQECYRTNTITMNAGFGCSYFSNVPVDQDVMQNIIFPTDEENRGSAVAWIRNGISNSPIVIANLRKQDDYYVLDNNQRRVARETADTSVETFMDGTTATYLINIVGNKDFPAKVKVKLSSSNKDSVFDISSDNALNVNSDKQITLTLGSKIDVQVKKEGEVKCEMSYTLEEGLHYKDEFDNEVTCKDGEVDVVSKKINHNEGKEPMVLGDTLADLLKDICDAISKLTVMTPAGGSSVPVNVSDFVTIRSKIDNIKSQKSNLE